MHTPLYVIATLQAKPGHAPDVLALARPCIDATRREAGCQSYDLTIDSEHPDQLVFVERWVSRAALADHFKEPHLVAFSQGVSSFVESSRVEVIHAGQVEVL